MIKHYLISKAVGNCLIQVGLLPDVPSSSCSHRFDGATSFANSATSPLPSGPWSSLSCSVIMHDTVKVCC
ncbi:unnamed protein product [Brassica napus]|uniref:(rape) hypothetical protein n=1 Tax=Brassica napus TaxID=3708 RepID=A0A816T1P7_BRANA|nr:unnamed protein product [Brassica napus]